MNKYSNIFLCVCGGGDGWDGNDMWFFKTGDTSSSHHKNQSHVENNNGF